LNAIALLLARPPAETLPGSGATAPDETTEVEMQTDRTTKALLFVIALGLWVNIAKDVFRPGPTQAQDAVGLSQPVRIVGTDITLPVNLTRQTQPIEVKLMQGGSGGAPAR
jgi:hypothetical protein